MPFHPAPSSILDWHWYSIFFAGDSFVKWMRKIVFISAVIKAYSMPSNVDNNSDQNKIRKISLEYTLCTLYTASPSMLYAGHNIIYLWMAVEAAAEETISLGHGDKIQEYN